MTGQLVLSQLVEASTHKSAKVHALNSWHWPPK